MGENPFLLCTSVCPRSIVHFLYSEYTMIIGQDFLTCCKYGMSHNFFDLLQLIFGIKKQFHHFVILSCVVNVIFILFGQLFLHKRSNSIYLYPINIIVFLCSIQSSFSLKVTLVKIFSLTGRFPNLLLLLIKVHSKLLSWCEQPRAV